jgi:glycosyltransferase involved in cell wall biosynthesis
MRIGIIAHNKHALTEPMFGGLESFTYDLVLALKARGHKVVLFGVIGSSEQLGLVPCLSPSFMAGTDCNLEDFVSRAHHEYLAMMLGIDDYGLDVIFNNSLHYVPVTMATLVKTPMLTVLHTPPIPELVLAYSHPNVGGYLCSPSRANARSWEVLINGCDIIPNAVDLNLWKPRGRKSADAIWSGRIVPEKGLHLAIDAAKAAQIHLRIAGPISDDDYYEEYIQPRLGEGVTYLGHLTRPKLAQEIASASVAVVTPRWEEPFGLVVAEAIASGTPVAGFNRGALTELVTPDVGVLAKPDDIVGLAQAIRSALNLDTSRCRSIAETRWSFDDQVSRYEYALAKVARFRGNHGLGKSQID